MTCLHFFSDTSATIFPFRSNLVPSLSCQSWPSMSFVLFEKWSLNTDVLTYPLVFTVTSVCVCLCVSQRVCRGLSCLHFLWYTLLKANSPLGVDGQDSHVVISSASLKLTPGFVLPSGSTVLPPVRHVCVRGRLTWFTFSLEPGRPHVERVFPFLLHSDIWAFHRRIKTTSAPHIVENH